MGRYHHAVLEGFVKLSADVVRPYASQDTVHPIILKDADLYWPFFKVR